MTLAEVFEDLDAARGQAAATKDVVLSDLESFVELFAKKCSDNGATVFRAKDSAEANTVISTICARHSAPGDVIVKAKSMVSEEIGLNEHLASEGYNVVETDLGEFVIQLDHDTPSHIVAPIIHKNRYDVARTFHKNGLGPYSDSPEILAEQARSYLRDKFQQAAIGISGVNFGIVDSGRLVIVENEGNNRLSTTAPNVHIAVMGIEKLLPSDSDVPLFLKLLVGSATGQRAPVYTHFVSRPRVPGEVDGPSHVYIVLLDNGRSRVANGPYRSVLRCVRCGACMNVCPVYRQSSGHAYAEVYSGPIGAVLNPALKGPEAAGDIAKNSTLCGMCEVVCPVMIPIPDLLVQAREDLAKVSPGLKATSGLAVVGRKLWLWNLVRRFATLAFWFPNPWTEKKEAPRRDKEDFRVWWSTHRHRAGSRPATATQARTERPSEPGPARGTDALWSMFNDRLVQLGGKIATWADVEGLPDRSWCVEGSLELPMLLDAASPWKATTGFVVGAVAVAETGSVLLRHGSKSRRLASLAPPHCVVVIPEGQIVETLAEGLANLGENAVLVTGPSRTADIEGILVKGVHGPKELWIVRSS